MVVSFKERPSVNRTTAWLCRWHTISESLFGWSTGMMIYYSVLSSFLSSSIYFLTPALLYLSGSPTRIRQSTPESVQLSKGQAIHFDCLSVILQASQCAWLGCCLSVLHFCVYCLWTEMKQGSASALGKAGEMLTSTAGRALPNTHTQGSHPPDPQPHTLLLPSLLWRVINLKKNIYLFFFLMFCHSVNLVCDINNVGFCWKLPVLYNHLPSLCGTLSSFPLTSTASLPPLLSFSTFPFSTPKSPVS